VAQPPGNCCLHFLPPPLSYTPPHDALPPSFPVHTCPQPHAQASDAIQLAVAETLAVPHNKVVRVLKMADLLLWKTLDSGGLLANHSTPLCAS
jgi:hypothetical protein